MLLNEIILAKPLIEEVSREKLPEGVLCRVTYPICNIGKRNANKRVYEDAVWDKVCSEKDLQEKLKNRALFGHAEHPEQTQSNLEKTSHVIFEMWKDDGQVWQKMDIVDTPTGRIVDTLLRANCQVGVSTRAEGDLEEAEDDEGTYHRVIPESYKYVTTDFTADPSTFGVMPHDVRRNIVSTVGKELSNEKADKSEKEFAKLLLESMRCEKKEGCQNCGCCKILNIFEGCWSYPYTEEKAKGLILLLGSSLTAKEAKDSLYDLLGDDTLFDALDKAEERKSSDVRPEIKQHIKRMLEMYHKDPGSFKYGFEPKALEILHSIVDEGVLEVSKENEKTIKDLITEGTIKVGTKVRYGNKDARVEKIEEGIIALTVFDTPESKGVGVGITGDVSVSVNPDGVITILPSETITKLGQKEPKKPEMETPPPPVEPGTASSVIIGDEVSKDDEIPPEEEIEQMRKAGPLPINNLEHKLSAEGSIDEELVPGNLLRDRKNTDWIVKEVDSRGLTVTQPGMPGTEKFVSWDDAGSYGFVKIGEKVELDERIVKLKDGYYVKSSKGKNLGGPYKTREEAQKRLDQVEMFKHMKKESKVDEHGDPYNVAYRLLRDTEKDIDEVAHKIVTKAWEKMKKDEGRGDVFRHYGEYEKKFRPGSKVEAKGETYTIVATGSKYLIVRDSHGDETTIRKSDVDESKLLEEFYNFMNEKEFPDWDEGVKLFAECKKVDVNKLTEQFVELFPDCDISENWKDLPRGWTKASLKSFARSLLGKVGKRGKGFVTACAAKMKGKVDNPEAFCAGLKDEVMGTTKWRGKESKDAFEPEYEVGDTIQIMDKEGNTVIIPKATIWDVDEILGDDGEMHTTIEITGSSDEDKQQWYRDDEYQIVLLGKVYSLGWGSAARSASESISTTTKEIKHLRVQEASARAERDKALELLEELTDEKKQLEDRTKKEKALEVKILVKKLGEVVEAREQEVDALRAKLEEKAKLASDLKKQLGEKIEQAVEVQTVLNEMKTNMSNDIKSLKESVSVTEDKHQKEVAKLKEEHQHELNEAAKVTEEKIKVAEEKAKKDTRDIVTKEFVKSFVEFRLSDINLKVDENSRALLENCKSLEEVDELLDEILDVGRRGALHSESVKNIQVNKVVDDPEMKRAEQSVKNVFEGFGY